MGHKFAVVSNDRGWETFENDIRKKSMQQFGQRRQAICQELKKSGESFQNF